MPLSTQLYSQRAHPMKLDELEALARGTNVARWFPKAPRKQRTKNMEYIAAIDPATLLALIAAVRHLRLALHHKINVSEHREDCPECVEAERFVRIDALYGESVDAARAKLESHEGER